MKDLKLFIVAAIAMLIIVGIDRNVGPPQENIEPYTALCLEPTTQGGC